MIRYTVKVSDSDGNSANVLYDRNYTPRYRVEYFRTIIKVGEEFFNTEYEATKSAQKFISPGETHEHHFNIF